MGLPKQVEEAAESAEEYMENLNAAVNDDVDTEEADIVEDDTAEDTTEDTPVEEDEDFKAKYNALKGKYDAEVPRLHDELKELKENVFKKLHDTTEEKGDEPQDSDTQETPNNPVLDEFKEEYGEDLLRYLDAYFESKLPAVKEDLSATVKPVEEKVNSIEESQIKVAQEEFAESLDEAVNGDWRAAWNGEDPKFLEFLEQPDPSGLYKNADLAAMYAENWDANKLTKLLNMYYGEPENKKSDSGKDALVAPSKKSPVNTPSSDGDKRIWTSESIKQFEIDDRKNKFSAEESAALWEDLLSAPSEGRIR